MGLFDNLFLDKDTPMAINTGEVKLTTDDPKAPPPPTQEVSTGDGSGSGSGSGSGNGNGNGNESEIVVGNNPSSYTETTEKGNTPPVNITFDIGGLDISDFNSIVSSNPASSENSPSTTASEISNANIANSPDLTIAFKVDGVPAIAEQTSPNSSSESQHSPVTTGIIDTVNLDHLIENTTPSPEIQIEGTEDLVIKIDTAKKETDDGSDLIIPLTPQEAETTANTTPEIEQQSSTDDDILFSLINTDTETKNNTIIEEVPASIPSISEEKPEENLLASLTGSTEDVGILTTPEVTAEAQTHSDEVSSSEGDRVVESEIASVESEKPATTEEIVISNTIVPTIIPTLSTAILHPEERESSSNKLRSKLEEFIRELEELDLEDEKACKQREEQIAFYQNRIIELKSEYEKRIEALEFEKANLAKELEGVDIEREKIKHVIEEFKKKL